MSPTKQRVLILGGTGFLSSALVQQSQAAGHDVTIVTRGRAKNGPPAGVSSRVANRSDPNALRAALAGCGDFDIILDAILYRPADAQTALDLFRGRAGRYVFISTDFVYGGEPRTFPLAEDAPRHAASTYGRDKAACEDIFFAAWEQQSFPAVVLRPPHILGAGCLLGTGSREGRDPWLLHRLRGGEPIALLDGGAPLIQPVHRSDIARACLAVAASDRTSGRAYNIAGPDAVTTRRYYEMVAEAAGAPPPNVDFLPSDAFVAAFPDRASFALNRCYALSRLAADADFAPRVRLRDAVAEVVAALDAAGPPVGEPPPPAQTTALHALLQTQSAALREALCDS